MEGCSWGYDRHGIWVDDGCEARFEYGHGSPRRHSGRRSSRRDRDDHNHGSAAAAVVVGAGLAVLLGVAAVAASKDKHHDSGSEQPPSWIIGTYERYDDLYSADVEMTVHSDGRDVYSNGPPRTSTTPT